MTVKFFRPVMHALITVGLVLSFTNCSIFQSSQQGATIADAEMTNKQDTISYIIGLELANEARDFSKEYNTNDTILLKALRDVLLDSTSALKEEQRERALERFEEQREREREKAREAKQREQEKAGNKEAKRNMRESRSFLKQNMAKEEVQRTSSGLQYQVLERGDGASPGPSDKVKVHYKGKLIDGTVFDNSYDRGAPATFRVNQVIKGWQEGLQLMKTGGKYKLYIPPRLAYGKSGAGEKIGPNEALIFTVELLEVK